MTQYSMPKDFLWGTATSSYQVEGALDKDNREPSIWDTFCKKGGNVYQDQDGSVADDHYDRYEEDIAMMELLGFQAYRFSIAWPRIISYGEINKAGLVHYRKVIDCIHRHHMKAVVTLYHWDLPQSLEDKGGWLNRDTAKAFQFYAETCFKTYGDTVDMWITVNEPWCSAYLGYGNGIHAPGKKNCFPAAVHHLLLAHGLAVQCARKLNIKAPIGISLNPSNPKPATSREQDIIAAENGRIFQTDIFLEPLMKGKYPSRLTDFFGIKFPVEDGDFAIITEPIDFMGINYYNEQTAMYDENEPFLFRSVPCWQETTDIGWPITPYGLKRILHYFQEQTHGMPLYITENGAAYNDEPEGDAVHDVKRCKYLQQHVEICKQAIDEGVNLKGYFVWSFLDNFEWAYGYSQRFGIVYVDYKNQQRIMKDSAYLIRDFINNYIEY